MKNSSSFFRVPYSLLNKKSDHPYSFTIYQKGETGEFKGLPRELVESKDFRLSRFKSSRSPLFVSREDKDALIEFLGSQSGGRGDGFTKDQINEAKHILIPFTQIVCAEIEAQLPIQLREMFKQTQPALEQTILDLGSSAKGLSLVLRLFLSHDYLLRHSFIVSSFCFYLSQETHPHSQDRKVLALGGLLHDIGMMRIDEEVYTKHKLDESDWEVMRAHPIVGEKMLAEISDFDPRILTIISGHHSQPNGRGYGKPGNELSHLVGVVDAFATMIMPTPYRIIPRTPLEALNALKEDQGHFDRAYVELIKQHLLQPHLKKAS